MGHRFADIAFTQAVKTVQQAMGSRGAYARRDAGPSTNDRLGAEEGAFIAARDGFYIASVSETGWPYVQFRGGPPGFLRVLGETEIGFADFRGNRQYVTAGNVSVNDRVSLFLMDYAHRRRLKIFGRIREARLDDDPALRARLVVPGYRAVVERAFLIRVEAFDWNCPQHITPRFTAEEIAEAFGERLPSADAS
ncbi:pyridoxamine 5'-phosphate oxidase family protein [Salinarimonas soli]|uniref:Pyridoxamine 5-phosphate oxidase n=1 Tax=Salinarimonas soli TaxID=1638099 RepID=A0A5B2VDX3_9HYPH|nr:pyridoxamine 5'-phosphate oxidase family protein [Salinarimonas soli]KAA2236622.1 pyridoxamine 5-phosphate oxidase [Salinarimonas soli]